MAERMTAMKTATNASLRSESASRSKAVSRCLPSSIRIPILLLNKVKKILNLNVLGKTSAALPLIANRYGEDYDAFNTGQALGRPLKPAVGSPDMVMMLLLGKGSRPAVINFGASNPSLPFPVFVVSVRSTAWGYGMDQ